MNLSLSVSFGFLLGSISCWRTKRWYKLCNCHPMYKQLIWEKLENPQILTAAQTLVYNLFACLEETNHLLFFPAQTAMTIVLPPSYQMAGEATRGEPVCMPAGTKMQTLFLLSPNEAESKEKRLTRDLLECKELLQRYCWGIPGTHTF